MYGKFFASTYTGSMFGAGADVFAVWGYVVANTVDSQVELNPKLLAAVLGSTEDKVTKAIEYLCSPDPRSRSKLEDGKRLIREGQFAYRVPTHQVYRSIKSEDERREYNRKRKAESRKRLKNKVSNEVTPSVNDSQRMSSVSAHTEADTQIQTKNHTGGVVTNHSGKPEKITPPPKSNGNGKYTQADFDERDIRKLSNAESDLSKKLNASVGAGQYITEQEFFAAACEIAGITVERGLKLKQIQRQWPQ